jgi:hypothetical protein
MRDLPVQDGWPVPYFVAQTSPGQYDLRLADHGHFWMCIQKRLCWVCGKPLMASMTFVMGPMAAITRTHAEPACHTECAEYSALACPFLTLREKRRNAAGLPETVDAPGIMSKRQPGVVCLWRAKSCSLFDDGQGGMLIKVGDPTRVLWYTQGRPASRVEVVAAMGVSFAALLELALLDGEEAVAELEQRRERAMAYLPEEA